MLQYIWNNPLILGQPALVVICLLAFFKGGPAERRAAPIMLGVGLFTTAFYLLPGEQTPIVSLVSDFSVALALLWLAMRYRSLWLAGAMIAQGTSFALHAYLLGSDMDPMSQFVFTVGGNVLFWVVLWLILGGTVMAWRKRAKVRKAAAQAERQILAPGAA